MAFGAHSKNHHNVVFLLSVVHFISSIYGFNLESRLPLVKNGSSGTYFGFSVAAHQIRDESGRISEGLLLVGAPLGNNLQPNTSKSGALWKCPLTSAECTQVITDGRKEIDKDTLYPPPQNVTKNGQWLGVTVRSQGPGGKVLVCAHRYVSETYWCRGLCYVLDQGLEFSAYSEPCRHLSVRKGHEEFGMCQSGTSGIIFEDDYLMVGSPGALNWRGAVTAYSVADDFLNRPKGTFTGPLNSWDGDTKYGYLGMSVTAGYFNGDNITVLVAGAPRSNGAGQVVLFVKTKPKSFADSIGWESSLVINGEQFASNFGYQVATADVNGDRLHDLIVAAPFYFNQEPLEGGAVYIYINDPVRHLSNVTPMKLTGRNESRFGLAISSLGDLNKDGCEDIAIGAPYEGNGVVYVYLGSPNGLIVKPSQIIKAEDINYPLSTFGYSLSGGVDLDLNGYPDLLVGAYEKDAVVLLRARPIIKFTTLVRPDNNLTNINPNARNCLINNSNYISCFSFETCGMIDSLVKTDRSRNLSIKYELEAETFEKTTSRIWFDDFYTKNHNITKQFHINNDRLEFCQKHTAYLKENTLDIHSPIKIRMSYKLIYKEPEPYRGKDLPPLDDYPILDQQQADKIFEATFLKDCGSDDICSSRLSTAVSLMLEDDVPEPDQYGLAPDKLKTSHYKLILGEHKNLLMNIDVNNLGESAYQTQLYVQLPKQISFNKVLNSPNSKNQYICHSTEDTSIICMLGNPMRQNERANLQLEFDLGNINGSESSFEFTVIANTTSIDLNKNNDSPLKLMVRVVEKPMLSIYGHSFPEEVRDMRNIELKGESVLKYKEEIGKNVTHHYSIYNNGTWNVVNLLVEIEWPFEVANDKEHGKWLLYMDEYPIVKGGSGRCEISKSEINPLGLKDGRPATLIAEHTTISNLPSANDKSDLPEKIDSSSNARNNRVKRDTEYIIRPETYTNKDGKKLKIVKMNCVLNSAKCRKFSCILDVIESKQLIDIVIKSRLWDATLIEDYADVDIIKIASRAKMHIPKSPITIPNFYSNEFQVETEARVIRGQQTAAQIPLLFIIGAILVGLLLFILLTLLLWKLGFFKRRRPDPTLSGNLEKHRLDDS